MKKTTIESIGKAITYEAYLQMVEELLKENKTTGTNHSEDFLHYSKMNLVRMKRLNRTTKVQEDIKKLIEDIDSPQIWLIITEAWCGDAAQILPVIHQMSKLNSNISVRLVLRDEHPELMKWFLTNGGMSIPITVIVDAESHDVLGHWGPRPKVMQDIVIGRKNDPNATPYNEFVVEVQKWYLKDKTLSTQHEFADALLNASEAVKS